MLPATVDLPSQTAGLLPDGRHDSPGCGHAADMRLRPESCLNAPRSRDPSTDEAAPRLTTRGCACRSSRRRSPNVCSAPVGGQRFEFNTGGPGIVKSLPYGGATIDESQMFILGLDAAVQPETVAAHAYCIAAGVNEKIGVRLVTGEERKTILDNRKSFAASYLR